MAKPNKADALLANVLSHLKLTGATNEEIFAKIDEIVARLQLINAKTKIAVSTTGTITERLCEYGLRVATPKAYHKLGRDWKWIGDFYVRGEPFNTIITVKSFKAKERLLSSGTGNLLSPTIGFGLFDAPEEWGVDRMPSYVFRAFFAIYAPQQLLAKVHPDVLLFKNINGRQFLRPLDRFVTDLQFAMVKGFVDPRRL